MHNNNGLYWLRRDFRLDDNPALTKALAHGVTQALYIATPRTWQRHNKSPIQIDFIARHVQWMQQQLVPLGIELTIVEAADYPAQQAYLSHYCQQHDIQHIFANSEPEIDEITRDIAIANTTLQLHLFEADVILPKGSIVNKQGEMYKVFTPFKRAWLNAFKDTVFECIPRPDSSNAPTIVSNTITFNTASPSSHKWPLAEDYLEQELAHFLTDKLTHYQQHRDIPSIRGTSGLSAYLAIGAISPKRVLSLLLSHYPQLPDWPSSPLFSWLNELIWREFYRHLLFHFPNLAKHQDFQPKFNGFHWPGNAEVFHLWCEGKTGYPIVDAAMRQLNKTGWMHNRLRMIAASFLTKHLLVDWRKGEAYFMQQLIDGDFCANNGGWQWAAGTGCDAQPYFRIFNPLTQSKRYDPEGKFIRHYLPELKEVPSKYIHCPQDYLASIGKSDSYVPPLVDLKAARLRALAHFKEQLK